MTKCRVCRENETVWAWQPFGPDKIDCFTLSGNHYRGFPVINCCDDCKRRFQNHRQAELVFTYKHKLYKVSQLSGVERHIEGGWEIVIKPDQPRNTMNTYIEVEEICPTCFGEGKIETMTELTYDGAQNWHVEPCDRCHGDEYVIVQPECKYCGEIMLVDEAVLFVGAYCHEKCILESEEA